MTTLAIIEGCTITWDGHRVRYTARGRVDDDGTGSAHGDPYHQRDTSLHRNGRPLNADVDLYIVVPPQILRGVAPTVLGSQAWVTFRGNTVPAVVGDIGPHGRLGELSVALARALGINPDPNTGGVDVPSVLYVIQPGCPAAANGIQYQLQPA